MSIFIFFARADILVPISLVRVHEPLPLAKNYQLVCGTNHNCWEEIYRPDARPTGHPGGGL